MSYNNKFHDFKKDSTTHLILANLPVGRRPYHQCMAGSGTMVKNDEIA